MYLQKTANMINLNKTYLYYKHRGGLPLKKFKKTGIVILILALAAIAVCLFLFWHRQQTWPVRFHSELDKFFGEGNWEYLSEETKESRMYTVHYHSNSYSGTYNQEVPGKYHNWDIRFTNRDKQDELWTITDHAMKINHSKTNLFSSGRFSAKQALIRELMEVSFMAAGEGLRKELLKILPQQEADCLAIDISYRGGNPPLDIYEKLMEKPWFTADQVSVSDYLACDLYDFYLWIHAHDYRVKKLTEDEQRHLTGCLGQMEDLLRSTYGNHADYEIYLDDGHTSKYTAGLETD